MKKSKEQREKKELKNMDLQKLQEKLVELRKESLMLRLNSVSTHIKDYSQFGKIRKDIARVLTLIKQQSISKQ
jgi:large subunit ribosomal protein L29